MLRSAATAGPSVDHLTRPASLEARREEPRARRLPTQVHDETLAPARAPTPWPEPDEPGETDLAQSEARYAEGSLLGKGGMGEVRLCRDVRIGREVAMKVAKAQEGPGSTARSRFLAEARVQAQLEHPSIVPVYDIGTTPDGDVYFTMKRVRGMTLGEIVEGLASGDPEVIAAHNRRKLLTAFGRVCLAVDYAHSRGVLHRDLKPHNVMLGDFGEVYVLDWGLAKPSDGAGARCATEAGVVLGTPAYMAPEQRAGEQIDRRTDVFALGAILYEILTLEPLAFGAGSSSTARATSPHRPADARAARARAASASPMNGVPPELEQICRRATADRPEDRYATARELHDALEHFLDGDRDLARRHTLACEHARAAQDAARLALSADPEAHAARSRAMREAGRALALDPTSDPALRTIARLMMEPPAELPREVRTVLDASAERTVRDSGRAGSLAYVYCLLLAPLALAMGVENRGAALFGLVLILAAAVVNYATSKWPRTGMLLACLALCSVGLVLMSRMFGALFLVPGVALASTIGFSIIPNGLLQRAALFFGCLAMLAPLVLECAGILPPSYSFAGGAMTIRAQANSFAPGPTLAFLTLANLGVVVGPALFVSRVGRALARAERRLHLHAWHLRQLVPDVKRSGEEPE
ncbi:MAG: protein kinase [Deltaproteobacteria bacterium]|nr:protein kinase [Deltaproteobacteria bacterium]